MVSDISLPFCCYINGSMISYTENRKWKWQFPSFPLSLETEMGTFLEKTIPVIEAYKAQGKLKAVDGNGSVDEIYDRILSIVK